MTPLPWNDWVTATIDDGASRALVLEGPLRVVVSALGRKDANELRKMMLAFPDRRSPPYRIDGTRIGALGCELAIFEQEMLSLRE